MKTIFVSMFEGVEAKNLLRTGVVDRLIAEEGVRVVQEQAFRSDGKATKRLVSAIRTTLS